MRGLRNEHAGLWNNGTIEEGGLRAGDKTGKQLSRDRHLPRVLTQKGLTGASLNMEPSLIKTSFPQGVGRELKDEWKCEREKKHVIETSARLLDSWSCIVTNQKWERRGTFKCLNNLLEQNRERGFCSHHKCTLHFSTLIDSTFFMLDGGKFLNHKLNLLLFL